MFRLFFNIFLLLNIFSTFTNCWQDYDLQSLNTLNETSEAIDFHIKLKRLNRTTYALNGYSDLLVDVQTGYSLEANAWHSANGNNQYTQLPLRMARKSLDDVMNKEYRKNIMADIHKYSNLPYTEDKNEDILAIFKPMRYTLDNYIFDKSIIPKFLQDGTYKVFISAYNADDIIVWGLVIEARLY